MKKRQVLNLIKYHAQNNDVAFRTEAYEIAKSFDRLGDHSLAEYIMAQLSDANVFVPQMEERELSFFEKVPAGGGALPLPVAIEQDLIGIIHAVSRDAGVHKFLFQGPPGTGKTESAKQLARILGRELYAVDFASVVDSRLGQTQKNIADLFAEIRELNAPGEMMLLFDEIDSLALDRTNRNDLREMGRATSTVLKELDRLSPDVLLVATTNLFEHFDHALIRRFDTVIEFDRDLIAPLTRAAAGDG